MSVFNACFSAGLLSTKLFVTFEGIHFDPLYAATWQLSLRNTVSNNAAHCLQCLQHSLVAVVAHTTYHAWYAT